jgi:predicted transcriptional regulator
MSPRAACRLATLGFADVYDYVPGKAAWLAEGLDVEGEVGPEARVASVVRRGVPTCALGETVGDVAGRIGGWQVAVVVEDGVVLGLVGADEVGPDPTAPVHAVMRAGPSTFRPSVTCAELASYLDDKGVPRALVTTLHGRLVGLVDRADLEGCTTGGDAGG